jgi:hypothetical protein
MSYAPITDPVFTGTLESWFRSQPELLALIRYSHAGGSRAFRLFASFHDFTDTLRQLPHLACVTVFRHPQLPLRGVVDDAFIARCLEEIPNSAEYVVTELVQRVCGRASWFHCSSGESHPDLRDDLEGLRGAAVAAGMYPPWLQDTEDVVSAVVPDEHGATGAGIY